jgi:glycerol kinase
MMPRYVLAVDQGTTNTKVLLLDERAAIVARASRPVPIAFPQPGWVEQDGDHLWQTVLDAIDDCLHSAAQALAIDARRSGDAIAAIAITNQRESVIAWDRATGRPLGPCISWQCRRTTPLCEELQARGAGDLLRQRTGLPIDPLFSATKARWLLDHITDGRARAADGALCLGTIDSWLLYNFSGGRVHTCDRSNASRTQMYNLHTGAWDPVLLDLFGIPAAALPAIGPSSGIAAYTVARPPLAAGIPVASLIGDSHAALFGHAAFAPGTVKATYGTGSSLMTLIDAPTITTSGLATTVAWSLGSPSLGAGPTIFGLEGNITVTGAAVDWLAHFLNLPGGAREVGALAATVPDSGGVTLVPAFAGLGAPHWDPRARGLLHGLTLGTTAAHVAHATLDSIAWQVHDVLDVMRAETGLPLGELHADGGATASDLLMQLQADAIGCPVLRTQSADLSACGAAWLAGLATGVWPSLDALRELAPPADRFEPRLAASERERRLGIWRETVAKAKTRQEEREVAARPVASSAHGPTR